MMSFTCTVERLGNDGLHAERWFFSLVDRRILVDSYGRSTRATRRHKPRYTELYSRIYRTGVRPPLPADVAAEAAARFLAECAEITVDREDSR